ncbi:MAG: hypothetical protein NVS4B13_08600 [Candidatus Elarobacter sp.]
MDEDAALIYVSDDPETFTGHGRLFTARLPPAGTTARILFDHVNGSTVALRLLVVVAKLDDGNGTVEIAGVDAGAADAHIDAHNGMLVGHVATMNFLKARLLAPGGGASTVAVDATAPHVLSSRVMQPPARGNAKNVGECVAGIFDFSALDEGEYELRVMACDPRRAADAWDELEAAANPHPAHRSGVFAIPADEEPTTIAFGHGAKFGDKLYPRAEQFDPSNDPPFKGEYGVIKRFACELAAGRDGWLYQSTGAPGATATYIVDGRHVLTSSRFLPKQKPDKVLRLRPGSTAVVTMAEINSALPVNLSTGPDDPSLANAGSPKSKITVA